MHSEASAASISLHSNNTACLYKADGHKQTSSVRCRFSGQTERADMTPKCGLLPITENKENFIKKKTHTGDNMEEESSAVASHQLLTEAMWRQKEQERLLSSSMDLSALLQGRVKCRKGKPPSTKQTRREAFHRYMNIIYGLPPNTEFDFEDTFEPDTFSFHSEPNNNKPCDPPAQQEDVHPESRLTIPVTVEAKKVQQKKPPAPSFTPKTLMKFKPLPVERVVPKKEEPPEINSPMEQPKLQTPPPPSPCPLTPHLLTPRPRTPTPLPPREPTPEAPTFLKEFADTSWFRDLFPDKMSFPSTLSPEDFSLQLLGSLTTCSTPSKLMVVAALQSLQSQGLLQNPDKLYQGLVDLLPAFARPHMSPLERSVLEEILNLLVHLKPSSYDLMKTLLTLLAFKNLVLGETVGCVLTALGVDEAELWLWPELESWDLELRDQSNIWKSLHDRADWWLQLWTSKFKKHNRYLHSKGSAKLSPFSAVDVLNYFCSVQKEEEHRKAQHVAPAGHKNTVVLPLYDCGSSPIFRLGETYSMSRIRRPPGVTLPPLRNRPLLTNFPHFISLPFSRVTLSPFHVYSDAYWLKTAPRRYFIQQQSFVKYYR